jgi:hypothetical protein
MAENRHAQHRPRLFLREGDHRLYPHRERGILGHRLHERVVVLSRVPAQDGNLHFDRLPSATAVTLLPLAFGFEIAVGDVLVPHVQGPAGVEGHVVRPDAVYSAGVDELDHVAEDALSGADRLSLGQFPLCEEERDRRRDRSHGQQGDHPPAMEDRGQGQAHRANHQLREQNPGTRHSPRSKQRLLLRMMDSERKRQS